MWDDEQDSSTARSQLIAMVLMTLLIIVWFNYFLPPPRRPAPQPPTVSQPQVEIERAGTSEEGPSAEETTAARWPYLPDVPDQEDPAADEVVLEDNYLRLVFTRIGGRLKRAYVKLHTYREDEVQLVPEPVGEAAGRSAGPKDTETVYPLGLRFDEKAIGDELDWRRFDAAVDDAAKSATFTLTLPNTAVIRKTFSLAGTPYLLEARVEYRNMETEPRTFGPDQRTAYTLNWGPNIASPDKSKGVQQALVWAQGGLGQSFQVAKMKRANDGAPFLKAVHAPEWFGVKSAYFVVACRPEFPAGEGWALGDAMQFRFGIGAPGFTVQPNETHAASYQFYMGPNQQDSLAAAWPGLTEALRFFERGSFWSFMDPFAKFLLAILNSFYRVIPSYGVAIILLTVIVRMGMYPLTIKQMRSMKRMQLLAPEIEQLKAKYGDNQQEMGKKMMELYRQRGVNPMGGCLPILLQMPVFIALYRMLWCAFELRGAPFILLRFGDYAWMRDLSEPDRLFHMPWMQFVPFLGRHFEHFNLLPLLSAAAMVLNTKLTPGSDVTQSPQQKMMMTVMPVVFSLLFYNFASGLNVYILTSTALGILQMKFMPVGEVTLPEKRAPRRKQHFYTAAKARQRRLEKEAREQKKRGEK